MTLSKSSWQTAATFYRAMHFKNFQKSSHGRREGLPKIFMAPTLLAI